MVSIKLSVSNKDYSQYEKITRLFAFNNVAASKRTLRWRLTLIGLISMYYLYNFSKQNNHFQKLQRVQIFDELVT